MLVALLALLVHPPVGVDPTYYQRCMQAFQDENYCCYQAGGEIVGSTGTEAICGNPAAPVPPPIVLP